jgi:hypothetical protein
MKRPLEQQARAFQKGARRRVIAPPRLVPALSLFDIFPGDMQQELLTHLSYGDFARLALTCKTGFRLVFVKVPAFRRRLPADWDETSVLPVGFLGQDKDVIAHAVLADYRRIMAHVFKRDGTGAYVNVRAYLPTLVEALVTTRAAPNVDSERRLRHFLQRDLTRDFAKDFEDDEAILAGCDPLWVATRAANFSVIKSLLTWRADKKTRITILDRRVWTFYRRRMTSWLAQCFDDLLVGKEDEIATAQPRDFLVGFLELSLTYSRPTLPYMTEIFWQVVKHERVSVADLAAVFESPRLKLLQEQQPSPWLHNDNCFHVKGWTKNGNMAQLEAKKALLERYFDPDVLALFAVDMRSRDLVAIGAAALAMAASEEDFDRRFAVSLTHCLPDLVIDLVSFFYDGPYTLLSSTTWQSKRLIYLIVDHLRNKQDRVHARDKLRMLCEFLLLLTPETRLSIGTNSTFMAAFTLLAVMTVGKAPALRVVACLKDDTHEIATIDLVQ